MTLEDCDQIIEEAFSFLMSDFGYSTEPSTSGGGRFGSGMQKIFSKDRLTITLFIGDVDSQSFCSVFFSDGEAAKVEPSRCHFRQRTLRFLLRRKHLDSDDFDINNHDSDTAKSNALAVYGNLVKKFALDVVQGDFSAFPKLAYVLHHVDRLYPTGEVRRFIGVYSSYSEAEKAISERLTKPGFVVRQEGFEVDCVELDRGDWMAGIPIYPSDQATEFFKRVLKSTSLSEFNSDERRQIEAQWRLRFSAFQDQFVVSRAKFHADDRTEWEAVLARYPRDHFAWSVVLDEPELKRSRSAFVDELRNHAIGLECWKSVRGSGTLNSQFVAFIDEQFT